MIRLLILTSSLAISTIAQALESAPSWLAKEKLELIDKIGIYLQQDIISKGNYHYSYIAGKELKLNGFSCPIGTIVDVSRNIILIRASKEKPCLDKDKKAYENLKLHPDSSVTSI